ncbi:formate dehydrogenase subunit gamma [Aquamicrobium sp. LC103]|uniref:formate dehydrogenase subunit gamma n=1 Tax=Aquamicrobium sp. LC103 TaxID=1120658 RepID=UPI00063E9F23|nr:formate dehydrogenase subunit gamma [Aquamicrobium sp. LC103]TKT69107.1 formate dehydrogenase subunit gamma [Aquamicrobium sp. LC103]
MTRADIDRGDRLRVGREVVVDRYTKWARINHWITAISLILLALSGLALFHPSLFFLTALFGGGQMTRMLHPWIGVVLFFSFTGLFIRFFRLNLPRREDVQWASQIGDVLSNQEEKLPEVGKYNAGQKFVFWAMSVLIIILIASGLAVWERYFTQYLTVSQMRVAVLVHSIAAVVIICVWIIHVYAAFWVQGTLRAMTRGSVSGGWAWRHHRKWLRALAAYGRKDGSAGTDGKARKE